MVRSKLCAHTCTTHRRPVPDRGPSRQDGRIKPRRELRYRRSLIYKVPIFRMLGASARYSRTCVPVETSTPPRRRSMLHIPRSATGGRARSFRRSSSSRRTRWRWAPSGGTGQGRGSCYVGPGPIRPGVTGRPPARPAGRGELVLVRWYYREKVLRWVPSKTAGTAAVLSTSPARGSPRQRSLPSPTSSAGPRRAYQTGCGPRSQWRRPPPCPQSPCQRPRTGRPGGAPAPP